MNLAVLDGQFAVCRLDVHAKIPGWARGGGFVSFTRTADEFSVVCLQENVPPGVVMEAGWRLIKVAEKLDFAETGILASLAGPLALAGISIFALSTYETDYILVKEADLEDALSLLGSAGHNVLPDHHRGEARGAAK